MNHFLIGGLMIGLGAITLLLTTGYVSGMNSMLDTVFLDTDNFQYRWKTLWLSVFLVIGILLSKKFKRVESLPLNAFTFLGFFILAFGVRMAQGCTSGHGINGLARLSNRSFIAVILFFSFAVITATNFKTLPIHKTETINKNIYIPLIAVLIWVYYAFDKTTKKDENKEINIYNILAIILSAGLFSGGLYYSGMYEFSVVKNFLNLKNPNWDYGLLIVFMTAVGVAFIGYRVIGLMDKPFTKTCEQTYIKDEECKFMLPKRNTITKKLIIGSILFGIGWGITGMCPSTFPIRLGIGDPSAYIALIALFIGYHSEFIFENLTFVNSNHESLILHQFFDPPSSSFTYIVGDKFTNEVVIIDSVYNETNYEIPTTKLIGNLYYIEHDIPTHEALIKFCDNMNYKIKYLLNTHIHVDHITANDKIKQIRYIPSIIGSYSGSTKSDYKYDELNQIDISENLSLESFKTPGHTKDCYSLILRMPNNSILFSGDVLLITGVGRTDLDSKQSSADYKTNKEVLLNSLLTIIEKINKNPTTIYPAHDYTERRYTTYDEILNINPYLVLAYEYYKTKDEKYKSEFIETFTKKEQSLAHFDEYDINLCVDINKMCGVVDNISYETLDQLWSKESGACG